MHMEATTVNILIVSTAALIALGLISAAVTTVFVARAAFRASSPSAAGTFGLLFLALPALSTIVLIVLATATLTAMNFLKPEGCIAIFSSVASFVLGAETQKRKGTPKKPRTSRPNQGGVLPTTPQNQTAPKASGSIEPLD